MSGSGSEFRGREESSEAMDTREASEEETDDAVFEKDATVGEENGQEEGKGEEAGHEVSDSDSSDEKLSRKTAALTGKKIIALFHKLRMESGLCSKHASKHFVDDCLSDVCKLPLPEGDVEDELTDFPHAGDPHEDSGIGSASKEEGGREQARGSAWKVLDPSAEVGTEEWNAKVKAGKDVSNCFTGTRYGRRSSQSMDQKKKAVRLLEGVDVSLDIETGKVSMPRAQFEGLRAQLISMESVSEKFRRSYAQFYNLARNEIEDQNIVAAIDDVTRDVQLFSEVTLQEVNKLERDGTALRDQLDRALKALKRKEIELYKERNTLRRLTSTVQENIDVLSESVKRKPSVTFMQGKLVFNCQLSIHAY